MVKQDSSSMNQQFSNQDQNYSDTISKGTTTSHNLRSVTPDDNQMVIKAIPRYINLQNPTEPPSSITIGDHATRNYQNQLDLNDSHQT